MLTRCSTNRRSCLSSAPPGRIASKGLPTTTTVPAAERTRPLADIPQITVLDAGGQYCHLIARRVRDLGVYAEVLPSDTRASELRGRKGLIISGGPSSVYESGSPRIDPAILQSGAAVLGICYGLH